MDKVKLVWETVKEMFQNVFKKWITYLAIFIVISVFSFIFLMIAKEPESSVILQFLISIAAGLLIALFILLGDVISETIKILIDKSNIIKVIAGFASLIAIVSMIWGMIYYISYFYLGLMGLTVTNETVNSIITAIGIVVAAVIPIYLTNKTSIEHKKQFDESKRMNVLPIVSLKTSDKVEGSIDIFTQIVSFDEFPGAIAKKFFVIIGNPSDHLIRDLIVEHTVCECEIFGEIINPANIASNYNVELRRPLVKNETIALEFQIPGYESTTTLYGLTPLDYKGFFKATWYFNIIVRDVYSNKYKQSFAFSIIKEERYVDRSVIQILSDLDIAN